MLNIVLGRDDRLLRAKDDITPSILRRAAATLDRRVTIKLI
jgi:hypothetical protein